MKRIYYIIFVLLLSLLSGRQAYAALSQSGTWASQTIKGTQSVELKGNVNLSGPIIIESGASLTITMHSSCTTKVNITPVVQATFRSNIPNGCPTCLFYVKSGGKLVIRGTDANKWIALIGNHAGKNYNPPIDSNTNQPLDVVGIRAEIDGDIKEGGSYVDFAGGGLICAIGQLDLQYVRLYGMGATSGSDKKSTASAIYRPKQDASTKYTYGKILIKDSRITHNKSPYGTAILIERQIAQASDATNNTPESCSVTLQNLEIQANIASSNKDAGIIRCAPGTVGNLHVTDCKIYRNYSFGHCAGIYWNARTDPETKLKITGGSLEYNHSEGHGAALMLEGSVEFAKKDAAVFSDQRCRIRNNVADTDNNGVGNGGGIYIRTYGLLATKQSTTNLHFRNYVSIQGNRAVNGGGIAVDLIDTTKFTAGSVVNLNLVGLDFSSNTASQNGGGLYLLNNNTSNNINIIIDNNNISNTTNKGNVAGTSGGGIYLEKGDRSPDLSKISITLNGAKIQGNKATNGSGGGVYLKGLNVTSDQDAVGVVVAGNTSKEQGGGICVDGTGGGVSMTISNGTIGKYEADNQGYGANISDTGGGIYVSDATLTINGGLIIENQSNSVLRGGGGVAAHNSVVTVLGGSIVKNDSGTANGGGLYLENCNSTFIGGTISGNKTVRGAGEDGLEINNTGFGGGVYIIEKDGGTSSFILKGDTEISENSACSGAGVLLNGGDFDMTGGTIDSNRSEWHGGAICVIKADSFNLTSGDITNNTTALKNGGAIYYKVEGGTININGANISHNTSDNVGGAIYVEAGSLSITDGTLSYNTSGNNGGAINFNSPNGHLTVNGGSVSYNKAAGGNGGGIYVGNGDMTILGGVIDHNQVTAQLGAHGGGVSFMPKDSGKMIMDGGVISNNSASGNAGGILFCAGTMEIRKGEIFGNTANQEGGGLGMRDVANFPSPTLATISGGKIYSNRANLGGGIHLETTGKMRLTDGEIYDNECSYQGGGMNIEKSGGVTIDNGTIRNNRAIHTNSDANPSGNGAGILLGANGGHLVINGGTIKKNSGWSGSGVYMTGGSCTIKGGTISENNAERNGGGLYLSGGTGLDIENGLIENNVAANMGGGIVVDSANPVTVNISGGKINTNSAPLGGGLVASQSGSVVNMTGGEICNNTARVGGGAYLSLSSTLNFGSGIIVNNKAIRMADVTDATTGWYAENVADQPFQGVGGGVCVANAKLSFDLETTIGLYGNQADLLGDDIYSTGRGGSLSVTLPCVKDMNLTGYQAATTDLQWMEDYVNGDTGYANGTKVNTAQGYVPKRYRQALADKENVYAVDIPEGGKTFTGTYLALALGYDIMHLTLQRKGLMKGENAIYKISKWNETSQKWETYSQVLVSGPQEATTKELASELVASKTIAVYAGKWRAEEIGWDWSYTGTSAIERELSSATPKEDRYFIFNATKDTDISASQHSESVVVNDFGSRTVDKK